MFYSVSGVSGVCGLCGVSDVCGVCGVSGVSGVCVVLVVCVCVSVCVWALLINTPRTLTTIPYCVLSNVYVIVLWMFVGLCVWVVSSEYCCKDLDFHTYAFEL